MHYSDLNSQKTTVEIQKNNQKIAHDLRSPISALNIVASLTAEQLPEISRNLLNMAIARLQDMANSLEAK